MRCFREKTVFYVLCIIFLKIVKSLQLRGHKQNVEPHNFLCRVLSPPFFFFSFHISGISDIFPTIQSYIILTKFRYSILSVIS